MEYFCSAPLRDAEFEKAREMAQFFAFAVQRADYLDGAAREHEAARQFSDRTVPSPSLRR